MTVLHEKRKYTYEDYCQLPEKVRAEVLDGELLMSPSPFRKHQEISREIEFRLCQWVETHPLGKVYNAPFDVVLSQYDIVQPDLLYISNERRSILTEANVQGAPDFVIEILSSGDKKRDTIKKKGIYEKYGVKEYWIVDPDTETISVFILEGEAFQEKGIYKRGQVIESFLLPGFTLVLEDVFKSDE
jgi:Uma2 family endonuclease